MRLFLEARCRIRPVPHPNEGRAFNEAARPTRIGTGPLRRAAPHRLLTEQWRGPRERSANVDSPTQPTSIASAPAAATAQSV